MKNTFPISVNRKMGLQCQCHVNRLWLGKELCTYMRCFFPRCAKNHSKKWACNANVKFDYNVLEKSFSHINKYIFISSKIWFPNLALLLEPPFLDWRLTRFGKELFICTKRSFQNTISEPGIGIANSICVCVYRVWKRALQIHTNNHTHMPAHIYIYV